MADSGSIRRLFAALGATLWILAVFAGTALAAEHETCEVEVNPRAAAAGSVFVFNGSGFVPTELELQKEGGEPIGHDPNVDDDDPWEVTVRSRTGDEGTWTATFSDPAVNCTATVDFRVTLSSTDLVDDIAATVSSPAPLLIYLAVIVLGFGGGVLIGRRVRTFGTTAAAVAATSSRLIEPMLPGPPRQATFRSPIDGRPTARGTSSR